jgi:glycosyltransferase involved in cell wall biosynthesis
MNQTFHRLPVIAIVTPSYNQAAFLEQTIRSVLQQDGRGVDFELRYAVMDGGSSDGSREIIQRYESELDCWCSEKDRGQAHAINKGFAQISGDICGYINSDDYYLPGAFRQVAQMFHEAPNIDLLHGICQRVDASGSLLGQQLGEIRSLAEIVDLWERWLRPKQSLNFIQPEVFWSHRLAQSLGPFEEKLHYTMDFDYWLRGFDRGMNVRAIQVPLAAFRIHGAQKTSDRNGSILELLAGIEPFLEREDDRIPPEDRQRMKCLSRLTRRMIDESTSSPASQVRTLLSLAAQDSSLWNSAHFWRYLRRSSRRVILPRRVA